MALLKINHTRLLASLLIVALAVPLMQGCAGSIFDRQVRERPASDDAIWSQAGTVADGNDNSGGVLNEDGLGQSLKQELLAVIAGASKVSVYRGEMTQMELVRSYSKSNSEFKDIKIAIDSAVSEGEA